MPAVCCTLAARLHRAKAFHAGNFTNTNNTVLVQQKQNLTPRLKLTLNLLITFHGNSSLNKSYTKVKTNSKPADNISWELESEQILHQG